MTTQVDQELLKKIEDQCQSLLSQGKAQESIDLMDRVSEDLSGFPSLYKLKGMARLLQGSNSEARLIFDELEGSFGDDSAFLNIYGVALRREKDLRSAQQIFQRALELSPDEPAILNNYGNLLIDLGKFSEARTLLEQALTLSPGYRDALQNLARLNSQIGVNTESLSQDSHEAPAEPPSSLNSIDEEAASDWLKLASIAQRDSNPEESLVFARKAVSHAPALAHAYKLAGEVLASLSRFDAAEQSLLYGILLGDPDANSLSNLGGICAQRGMYPLARLLLTKALALQPEHKVALKNLELLKSKAQGQNSNIGKPLF